MDFLKNNENEELKKLNGKKKVLLIGVIIMSIAVYLNFLSLGFLHWMGIIVFIFEIIFLIAFASELKVASKKIKTILESLIVKGSVSETNNDNEEDMIKNEFLNKANSMNPFIIRIKAIANSFLVDLIPPTLFVVSLFLMYLVYDFNTSRIIQNSYVEFTTTILMLPLGVIFLVMVCLVVPYVAIGGTIPMAKSVVIRTENYSYQIHQNGGTIRASNAATGGIGMILIGLLLFVLIIPIHLFIWLIKLVRILISTEYAKCVYLDLNILATFKLGKLELKKNKKNKHFTLFGMLGMWGLIPALSGIVAIIIALLPTPTFLIQSIDYHAAHLNIELVINEKHSYYDSVVFELGLTSKRVQPISVEGEFVVINKETTEMDVYEIDIGQGIASCYNSEKSFVKNFDKDKYDFEYNVFSVRYDKGTIYYIDNVVFPKPYTLKIDNVKSKESYYVDGELNYEVKETINKCFWEEDLAVLDNYFNFEIPCISNYYWIIDDTKNNKSDVRFYYFNMNEMDFVNLTNYCNDSYLFKEKDVTKDGYDTYWYEYQEFNIGILYDNDFEPSYILMEIYIE